MDLHVVRVERVTVKVPFREVPERNMARELPHWKYFEIFEVHLHGGHVGYGETMLYYTWGVSSDEDVRGVIGQNAGELMWDDSLGAGLQMALFDAVARAAGVPIHCLLGSQVHQRTPLSWWAIDMPGEDWAAECREALRLGYRDFKTKGRPWWDNWKQVEAVARVVPDSFRIDIDYNSTLLDAERAIPILKDLQRYPQIAIYETPIPQGDVEGNQAIRKATRVPIAMHYGSPPPLVALKTDVCDGFVVGGGARRVMEHGIVAAMADKAFWLQLVGTGITAAFSLHFGAVLSHASWPAVNCHQLFVHPLLTEPIRVVDGFAAAPDGPGLGYQVDKEAVERFRVEKPKERPNPPRLIEVSWPDGLKMYYANGTQMLNHARGGGMPFYKQEAATRLVPDDGSARWRQLHAQALREPVVVKG